MNNYFIYINGAGYGGEDPEKTYPCDYGGSGFHTSNHSRKNVLIFGNEAKVIEGNICLRSHLDKILDRMREGRIIVNQIIINCQPDTCGLIDIKKIMKLKVGDEPMISNERLKKLIDKFNRSEGYAMEEIEK